MVCVDVFVSVAVKSVVLVIVVVDVFVLYLFFASVPADVLGVLVAVIVVTTMLLL